MKKKLIIILIVILCLGLIGGLTLFLLNEKKQETFLSDLIEDGVSVVLDENSVPKYIDGKFSAIKVTDEKSALNAIEEIKGMLCIDNVSGTLYLKEQYEFDGVSYFELQEKISGIDVIGAEMTISVDKDGNIMGLNNSYIPSISVNTYGLLTENEVKEKLESTYGEIKEYSAEKYIYSNESSYVVYIFDFVTDDNIYEVTVNAKDGEVLSEDDLMDYVSYEYTGFGLDDKEYTINLNSSGSESKYEFYDLERNIVISDGRNYGMKWKIIKGVFSSSVDPYSVTIEDDKIVSTDVDFDKLSVTAMATYEEIYDYYKNVLNRDSYDNAGGKIVVYLSAIDGFSLSGNDDYFQNAFWFRGTDQMFIGYYGDVSFVIGSDVLAHEFTHGVVSYTSNFSTPIESDGEPNYPGALNEAYADIMASLFDGDWTIGEDFGEEKIIRSAINPNEYSAPLEVGGDYYYPDYYMKDRSLDEFLADNEFEDLFDYDSGGVHQNSTVVYHAAYLMYENGAFTDMDEMAKVWYNSLFLLSSYSDFEDCAYAVIRAAANLGLSSDKIDIIISAFYETNMFEDIYYNLSGTVTDGDNGIDGVLVSAVNKENPYINYDVYTDENGKYIFNDLPSGNYDIYFDKAKYTLVVKELEHDKDKDDFDVELEIIDEVDSDESEVIFVMDISASMTQNDPTDIRKGIIINILSSMYNSNSKVALITFAKNADVVNNELSDKDIDKKILMTDIYNISNDSGRTDNSGTNGKAGLEKAIKTFESDDSRKYIVFLTDGEDNVTTDVTYDELIEKANKDDIRILCIGLGEELDEDILKYIAEETNGKYYHATTSSLLYSFDKRIFDELE